MSVENSEGFENEFEVIMRRCGLIVPAERRSGTLATYRELSLMAALLRQPRDAASEPSNVFAIDTHLFGH